MMLFDYFAQMAIGRMLRGNVVLVSVERPFASYGLLLLFHAKIQIKSRLLVSSSNYYRRAILIFFQHLHFCMQLSALLPP